MQKRGRVGKAQITGIGIVGWPASGSPFGVKKSLADALTNYKEKDGMSNILKAMGEMLMNAGLIEEKAQKGNESDQDESTDQSAEQVDESVTVSKSDFDALIQRVESIEKSFQTLEAEVLKSFEGFTEVIKGIQTASESTATEAKKSVDALTQKLADAQAEISKMANYVPAGQDLGGPETPDASADENSVEAIYKGSAFDHMLKKLRRK